jgi:hypothetical protein
VESSFLVARRQELEARARQRGIDWESACRSLPDDDHGAFVAALAGLLGFDIQRAFEPDTSLDALDRVREEQRTTRESELERIERDLTEAQRRDLRQALQAAS